MVKFSPILIASLMTVSVASEAGFLSGSVYEEVGNEYGIDPVLLYAVSLTESGFSLKGKKLIKPWPWTLAYPGGAFFAATKKDAELELKRLQSLGISSIDVGLMQVNLRWNGHLTKDKDVFDPKTNLRIGSEILRKALASSPGDLADGIGRYHTWTANSRQAGYALKVLRTYKRIKALDKEIKEG